jgi:hypothetical protein
VPQVARDWSRTSKEQKSQSALPPFFGLRLLLPALACLPTRLPCLSLNLVTSQNNSPNNSDSKGQPPLSFTPNWQPNTHTQIHSFSSCLIVFTSATPLLQRILIQFYSPSSNSRRGILPDYRGHPLTLQAGTIKASTPPVVNPRKFLNWPGAFTNKLRSNATLSKAPTSTPHDLNFSKSKAINLFRAKAAFPPGPPTASQHSTSRHAHKKTCVQYQRPRAFVSLDPSISTCNSARLRHWAILRVQKAQCPVPQVLSCWQKLPLKNNHNHNYNHHQ